MSIVTTVTADAAHRPDVVGTAPAEIMPEALFLAVGYQAGTVEGDAPAVRIPLVPDVDAEITNEGAQITEQTPALDEAVVKTEKLASIATVSREQASQPGGLGQIVEAMARGITRKSDAYFLSEILTGIDVENFDAGIDEIVDALAAIEKAFGQPKVIVAEPTAWASLAKALNVAHDAVERRIAGVPVITNAAMADGDLLVVGEGSVAYVNGDLLVATSDDAAFDADATVVRATLRLGAAVVHEDRIVRLNVGSEPQED